MQPIGFGGDMARARRVMIWSMGLLAVLALLALLLYRLRGVSLLGVIEIIAALGLLVFLATLLFLVITYLRQPEVKERGRLARQLKEAEPLLVSAQAALAEALQEAANIQSRVQAELEQARQEFDRLMAAYDVKLSDLRRAQEDALASELTRIQQEYRNAGLQAVPLEPERIPGIGAVLADQLQANGIRTAFDVVREAILAIPGFGESKALSLMRWRDEVERALIETQPTALPDEQRAAIEDTYNQQIRALYQEKTTAQANYEQTTANLRAQEAQEMAAVGARESSARRQLATMEAEKQRVQEKMAQYEKITFPRMLLAAVAGPSARWGQRLLASLALLAFVVLGLLQGVILVWALVAGRS